MDGISSDEQAYLSQLNLMAGSDPEVQVSMHDVGAALGLDKTTSGQMAETLFMGGYAELKTLSGGIGITRMGLSELGVAPAGDNQVIESLGSDPVLKEAPLECVNQVLDELRSLLPSAGLEYEKMDQAVTDIKTIEVQLLSPRPKTGVIREVFKSVIQVMDRPALSEARARLENLVQR